MRRTIVKWQVDNKGIHLDAEALENIIGKPIRKNFKEVIGEVTNVEIDGEKITFTGYFNKDFIKGAKF